MITEDRVRHLVSRADVSFQKFGPVYALTELLLDLKKELPTPIEETSAEEDAQSFKFSPEDITAMQNALIGKARSEKPYTRRPSHL